jgi:lauroyl/myristoyl acyltransferase
MLSVFSRLRKKISSRLQLLDYQYLLPFFTYLSIPPGMAYATIRGIINAIFDLDWRSLSIGKRYIRISTYQTMQNLLPDNGRIVWIYKTLQRFIVNSREEWEAAYFMRHSMRRILQNSKLTGVDALLEAQKQGRGVIILTPHFDSYCTGAILMAMQGVIMNAMTTEEIRNPLVHPAIQNYFTNKFAAMESYFNGGKIVCYENNMRFFYQRLKSGEALLMGADLPAPEQAFIAIPFLGKRRKMAAGPIRLAEKTGSLITAYTCYYRSPGRYELCLTPLYEVTPENIEVLYDFLSEKITHHPERWWTADLFLQYKNA